MRDSEGEWYLRHDDGGNWGSGGVCLRVLMFD